MRAGFAEVDITPPPGEEMTGYGYYLNRRARGTLDPLAARVVALDDGERRAAAVQLDVLELGRETTGDMRARASRCLGLAPEALLLHCTHTHTGPTVVSLEGCGTASAYYPRMLTERVLEALAAAFSGLAEVEGPVRFDVGFPEGFAYNRVGGEDVDTRVRGVGLQVKGAAPIVAVNYACHPVTLGRLDQYSADYPGYLVRELNAYGLRALYLNGPCGDINPLTHAHQWGSGTQDTLRIYGRDLAAKVRQGLASSAPLELGPLSCVSEALPLEHERPAVPDLREGLARLEQRLAEEPDDGEARVDAVWHRRMLGLLEAAGPGEDATAGVMTAEVQAIASGDLVLVGLGGEVFTRVGAAVREGAAGKHVLVAATSNAVLGYIPTPEDVAARGYASMSSAKLYGMAMLTPEAGMRWGEAGGAVVRRAVAPE